jgi:competence protein ComEA
MASILKKSAGILGVAVLMTAASFLPFADFAYAGPKPEAQIQAPAQVVNINTAGSEELQKLRGVGPAIAERILQYRQENGRFEKVEDLSKVRGIGGAKFEKMKSEVTI